MMAQVLQLSTDISKSILSSPHPISKPALVSALEPKPELPSPSPQVPKANPTL